LPTDDPRRKAELLARMSRTPQQVAASAFERHLLEYDAAASDG